MSELGKIDKNFEVNSKIEKDDIKFYNVLEAPFKIHGIFYQDGIFRRIPEEVARSVSPGVLGLHDRSAGGRIRFVTDSPYIAINVKFARAHKASHMSLMCSIGCDIYAKRNGKKYYINCFKFDPNSEEGYENVLDLEYPGLYEYTISMPLFAVVSEFYIGLSKDATVLEAPEYTHKTPIVYYGSSITHGACASRPGMTYEEILSRRFDCDYINLGFSGNAKAEDEIAEYISNLDMSIFVYDYDYNAPSIEHLEKTHKRMFDIVRSKNPQVPVIMMQRPKKYLLDWEKERFEIIKATYEQAKANGDNNVYLLDAAKLTELCGDDGTVDSVHPTDLGFMSMANAVGEVIEKILKK